MKSRGFWALQIAGWLAFSLALMVPWLGAFRSTGCCGTSFR